MPRVAKPRPAIPFPRTGTLADLALLLGVDEERLRGYCERAARLGRRDLFFGCYQADGEWMVPERVARRICAGWPLQHFSVSEVATLTGFNERYLRRRIVKVPAGVPMDGARPAHAIGARLFFGMTMRVPESELRRLAAGEVTALPNTNKEDDEGDA